MVTAPNNHVNIDDRGCALVGGTTVRVADIAIDTYVWGHTPEVIQANYPDLSLGDIYGALSYYHDHREIVDRGIEASTQLVNQLRTQLPQPLSKSELLSRLVSQ